MSPEVTSSRPAIMRSVVLLPQPEGPTSTTNSLSGMSRSMARTASTSPNRFTTCCNTTSAIDLPFGRAGGQAGNVIVHEEGINDERRRGRDQRAGHQHAPLVDVRPDQAGHSADREYLLVGGIEE